MQCYDVNAFEFARCEMADQPTDHATLSVLPVPIAEGSTTQRSQTTIPAVVRDAIGLEPGGVVCYEALSDGSYRITAKPAPFTDRDPVMLAVLDYFEQDMLKHPEKIVLLPERLISRMQQATESVPLPDPEDDFEMDEAEAAEYAELAAEVRAERQAAHGSAGVTRDGE
jgi:antitoxin PrlF